ncbi:carbon-nitrogen hydrolase family protein [Psychromarinibacter sp. C21-152]|uniref:Carbon-nitrogen hydrolase family protein n=1 Tax=Psychromarinibacter sediminicola TaxID=3033385 RepID=A0AAE3TAM0_9RHOB|nr:carbon-nitrogen hydrolase family protein [Psychromarinibacter sediminicola]MDF0602124.1 carbon-nitrogen hydrolase family protein [Psychromarinibacter sediminicola]
MKIAAAAYPVDWHDSWASYADKLSAWVEQAAAQGADLLVFPEYGAMELASLAGAEAAADLARSARAVAERMPEADALNARLATAHGVHVLGASGPVADRGRFVNRARLFAPDGTSGFQDKQIMTRFEREEWGIAGAAPLKVFDTALGRLGVLICYDSEFPLLGRALAEAGAEILLVPSNTEAASGYHRVRIGAMARALENQCVTVLSPTVGAAPWCEAVDINTGAAGIYGPPDHGFPETGVLAQGAPDVAGWVTARVDLAAVARVRAEGRVFNHADWPQQDLPAKGVEICHMRA